jgi:hypothetical protein
MKRQMTMIFASLLLMGVLTTITPAQQSSTEGTGPGGTCKIWQDGRGTCPDTLPPIRPRGTTTAAVSSSVGTTSWWYQVLNWFTGI